MNPFDGLKSEDEEEEPVVADSQEEEEEDQEVDEAELEAFLDGQLEDSLQGGSSQTAENREQGTFSNPSSKGDEALRTCKFRLINSYSAWVSDIRHITVQHVPLSQWRC